MSGGRDWRGYWPPVVYFLSVARAISTCLRRYAPPHLNYAHRTGTLSSLGKKVTGIYDLLPPLCVVSPSN